MSTRNKLVIGLFGFGVVGEGIWRVLQDTPALSASIKKVCIKHPDKDRNAPRELFTTNADELLNDPEINVIVELIDHAEDARKIVSTALKNKKSVVSANKKLIANHLPELARLRDEAHVSFLYEAAVCGSIPVIRNLEEYYDNDLLSSFSGIVNGSTNFILTKMKEEKVAYDHALRTAQDLGFAESDPSLDVEGIDAVNKLTIILKHAYGLDEAPEDILYGGITHIHEQDIRYATEKGYNIKLVANARHEGEGKIAAYVLPSFVPSGNQLHHIRNEYNGVLIGSKLADQQFLYGKGAGRYPTSSAVLSDISALQYDYRYEYRKSRFGSQYTLNNDRIIRAYVSFDNGDEVNEDDFEAVYESFKSPTRSYIIGDIRIGSLQNAEWFYDPSISAIELPVPAPAPGQEEEHYITALSQEISEG